MIDELHHIGVAVASLEEALPRWVDGFGLELVGVDDVPGEGVRVAILRAGSTRIELLEPMGDDTPVGRFVAKRGPGVHHLAFRSADTGAMIRVLTDAGAPMLNDQPFIGAHGTRCAFVHPKWLGGVLAEIVQDPDPAEASP